MLAAWAVLSLWLAVYPLAGLQQGTLWAAHVMAVVVLGAMLLPKLWRQPRIPLGAPGLVVLAALVSLLLARSFAPAFLPRREMDWAAVTGVAHALFFLICIALMPGADAPREETVRTRRLLAVLLSSIVLGQAWFVWGAPDSDSMRHAGTLGNPNLLGAMAAACGLALAGLAGLTPLSFLLVLSVLPLVLATGSRGAVAAFGATLLLLVVRRRRWKLLAALVAAGLAVLVIPNPLVERITHLQPEHSFARPFLWRAALESIAQYPLGIGPGMNQYVFPAHAWDAEHPWLLHQRQSVGITHNVLLTLVLEWGWLAGAAVLAFSVWAVLAISRQPLHRDRLGTGAALGATVLFLELQVDGLEQNPIAFSLFLLLAACVLARLPGRVAGADAGGRGASSGARRRGWTLPGRAVATSLGFTLLALAAVGGLHMRGQRDERRANAAVDAWREGRIDLASARAVLDRAQSELPHEVWPWMLRCDLEETNFRRVLESSRSDAQLVAAAGQARAAFDAARAAHPAEPSLPRRAASIENRLYFRTGLDADWRQRTIEDLQAVLALDPLDVETHWELAHVAQRAGLRELRDRQAAIVFELEPDYALAWDGMARLLQAEGDREGALHAAVRAEEALLNCAIKAHFPNPGSSAFYQNNLDTLDLADVRARIAELREALYF